VLVLACGFVFAMFSISKREGGRGRWIKFRVTKGPHALANVVGLPRRRAR
jgi:hypothetical protein